MSKPGPKPVQSVWSDEDFIAAVQSSVFRTEVIRKLGLEVSSTTYRWLYRDAARLGLDITHLNRASWGAVYHGNRLPVERMLTRDSHYQSKNVKEALWYFGLKERKCEWCGITEWRGLSAPLELDHVDGDNRNNLFENLRILCRNCHGQTDTFAGKNIGRVQSLLV